MPSEAENWQKFVEKVENPPQRLTPGQQVTKANLGMATMPLGTTTLSQRETRCRAVYKVAYSKGVWQRCSNIAYLDAYVDPDEQLGTNARVALCYVHAGVCMRGNLRVSR